MIDQNFWQPRLLCSKSLWYVANEICSTSHIDELVRYCDNSEACKYDGMIIIPKSPNHINMHCSFIVQIQIGKVVAKCQTLTTVSWPYMFSSKACNSILMKTWINIFYTKCFEHIASVIIALWRNKLNYVIMMECPFCMMRLIARLPVLLRLMMEGCVLGDQLIPNFTKWPPFRGYFQEHVHEWKVFNFDKQNPLKLVFKGPAMV